MARPYGAALGQCGDPLDALAAAADALYTSRDQRAALDAILRTEDALRRIPRGPDRDSELARAVRAVVEARALVTNGSLDAGRSAANRIYETAIVLLEPVRPAARIQVMLLRLLLRRMVDVATETGTHGPERVVLFARAASRAIALEAEAAASPLHAALEQVLAHADAAARAHDPDAVCDAAHRALCIVDALEDEVAGARRPFAAYDGWFAPSMS
jgi:hypothetical protein